MGFRDKLEDKKAVQSEAQAQEQASLEQEEAAAQEVSNANFQKTFQERASLSEALESFQASTGAVTRAKEARKRSATDVEGMITEAKEIDPTEEVTFKEIVKGANKEEKQGIGESEEARYHTASQKVKTARKQALLDAKNLQGLGIEAEGKSDVELAQELQRVAAVKQRELEDFVRANPDSELPEAREVIEQITKKQTEAVLEYGPGIRGFERVLPSAVAEMKRRGWRDEYLQDPTRAEEVKKNITGFTLSNVAQSKGFENFIKSIERFPQDAFSREAVSEALKQTILNYEEDKNGAIKRSDSTYSYDVDTYDDAPELLARIYEMDGTKLPETAFYTAERDQGLLKKGDRMGLRAEAGPLLASVFDKAQLDKFSEQILQLAAARKELAGLPQERDQAQRRKQELQESERNLSQEIEALEGQEVKSRDASLKRSAQREALEQLPARLSILLQGKEYAGIKISRGTYGAQFNLDIASFDDQRKPLQDQLEERRAVLKREATAAKTKYDEAKNAKRGFFNKKELKVEEDNARTAYEAALAIAENPSTDQEFERIAKEEDALRESYVAAFNEIREIIEDYGDLMVGIQGETPNDFLEAVRVKTAEEISIQTNTEEESGEALRTQQASLEEKRQQSQANQAELELLERKLGKLATESFEMRGKALTSDVERFQGQLASRF